MRYHLTPLRMTIIKKNNKCWRGCTENSHTHLVGMFTGIATMENSMEVSQKLKIELTHDPTIPLFGVYLKKTKIRICKHTWTPKFQAAIANTWKQRMCPSTMNG